jgi:hypothetical protein
LISRLDQNMTFLLVVALWLVVGAVVGEVEARHGAWPGGSVVSTIVAHAGARFAAWSVRP